MSLPRLVWLLVDGLSHRLTQAYLHHRPDSALAAMVRMGRLQPLAPLAPNCQTPPSLFSIWSGRPPREHGLLGYQYPAPLEAGTVPVFDAFERWPRHIDLAWDRYAAQGLAVRTCAVPFLQPARLQPWLLSATHVFGALAVAPTVLGPDDALKLPSGKTLMALRVAPGPLALYLDDTLLWAPDAPSFARCARASFPLGLPGDTHDSLAFQAVTVDGQARIVCLGHHAVHVSGSGAQARRSHGRHTPFAAANPGKLYQRGQLGRRLDEGGDGHAETLLFHLMRDVHHSFASDMLWAMERGDADLLVAYHPVIDLICHQLLRFALDAQGALDASAPVTALLMNALDLLDDLVRAVLRLLPAGTRLLLNSDHGMAPIAWDLCPNVHWRERGLLALDGQGRIDPDRSAVFYHPAENGLVALHLPRLAARGVVLHELLQACNGALDGAGLAALELVEDLGAELGGGWSGGHYLHAPGGVRVCADLNADLLRRSRKGGDHTTPGADPWLAGMALWTGEVPPALAGARPWQLTDLLPLALADGPAVRPPLHPKPKPTARARAHAP